MSCLVYPGSGCFTGFPGHQSFCLVLQSSQRKRRGNSEAVRRKRTIARWSNEKLHRICFAEKKTEQAEAKVRSERKRAELEICKAKKEVKVRTEKMRDTEYFWGMGYVTLILFAIIAVLFILVVVTAIIVEAIKRYKKCGMKFLRCF